MWKKIKTLFRKNKIQTRDSSTPPLPSVIFIIINNRCNLQCKMCDVGTKSEDKQFYRLMCPDNERLLDLEILKKLIDDVKDFKPLIAVTSTEPLLFKDLFNFVKIVKNNDMRFQLTTNGFLLPETAEKIIESELDTLYVSLDGPEEIHNEIRGNRNSFQKAIEGIKKINSLKTASSSYPDIHLNFTITPMNEKYLFSFLESIKMLEIKSVNFSHMNFVTDKMASLHNQKHGEYCKATSSSVKMINPEEVDIEILNSEIEKIKNNNWSFPVYFTPELNKSELKVFYNDHEKQIDEKKCSAPFNMAQLGANGDWLISTRCFELSMGNIFEEDFKTTWNGMKYREFRKWIIENPPSDACLRCCGIM